jgi:hypothetical protein
VDTFLWFRGRFGGHVAGRTPDVDFAFTGL